jgi:Ca-activated chloride channel family protein
MYTLLRLMAVATLVTAPLHAQGWIEIERPPRPGPAGAVLRVASEVSVTVTGRVARVAVEERFRNTGGGLAEGSYLYPLPGEAVFQNFSLWIGEQEIRGEVMQADEARGIYEQIVRRRRDPALLSLAGHGLVRAQVFPIGPGETRKVTLRYTQLLDRSGDAVRLRYALGDRGPTPGGEMFRVRIPDAASFGAPYSPTHRVTATRNGGALDVRIDPGSGGDIELFLPLRQGLVGTSVVAHAPGGEDGYFMLLLSPPPSPPAAVMPRDLTLIVDVSGSMSGAKLDQAKAALAQALGTLTGADRFRLIAFSSAVRPFRDGFVSATSDNIRDALGFVDGLTADGGTNIEGALDAALGRRAEAGRLDLVVFMTDGLPSVGERSPERLAERAAGRLAGARLFAVGIGHDVNTYLLDRLASEGRGSAAYVAPEASVETTMGTLLGKLRYPALVNLRIVSAPVRLHDASPATLPDLFYGEELVLLGRYTGSGGGPVVIEGERNGRRERFSADARFPGSEQGNEFVPHLWAARRIGDLTRQIRLEGASTDLLAEVRNLGLRYGILTEYTSYLVQEPGAVAAGGMPRAVASPAPEAQSGRAAFEAASRSADLSAAGNLAAARATEARLSPAGDAAGGVRRAGGRIFILRDGVWTDAGHRDSLHVTTVAPYSEAWFALVRALPELVPCLRLGDAVLVAGREASVRVAAGGRTTWRAGELTELVSRFRGT